MAKSFTAVKPTVKPAKGLSPQMAEAVAKWQATVTAAKASGYWK